MYLIIPLDLMLGSIAIMTNAMAPNSKEALVYAGIAYAYDWPGKKAAPTE